MLSLPLPFPPNSHRCCPPPTPAHILQPCCRTSCLALVKKQHCMHATELPTSYHPPACNALDHICCVHPLYIAHNACHCIITYDLLSCSHLLPGICSDLIPADCATVTQHHIATTLHLMCSPCTVPLLLHRCHEITMLLASHDAVTRRVAVDVLISLPPHQEQHHIHNITSFPSSHPSCMVQLCTTHSPLQKHNNSSSTNPSCCRGEMSMVKFCT
ncbi:hypothetical protein COO60DRAFT_1500209 [Scenedesmus sp. NREL 46B-D3]|nr:hypothetical protein COO60DRAFT_1500209 [Scenedesmus sp. NREL 46B-D3]